jgi:membrane fusion protein, multidrug efflux system
VVVGGINANNVGERMEPALKQRMIKMLIGVGILFGLIFLYHLFNNFMVNRYLQTLQNPIVTVSTTKAVYSDWQPTLKATASLRAIKGVNVTTELAGMVTHIYFTPGAMVNEGTILVQLNADSDIAKLHSLQANANLAQITYDRDLAQYKVHAVSKETVDTDAGNLKSLLAQVAEQAATVEKKTIRAPFTGKLGINLVNLGQYINPGDKVVSLQTLDPIYADFYVPQQELPDLKVGQTVRLTTNAFPNKVYTGKITTIDPAIDVNTRNVEVEATLPNSNYELTPGMFANVEIDAGAARRYITLPQAAISFNPYGDIVYIVHESKDKEGKKQLYVQQSFVTTGETRGDQITVLTGVKEGDIIVTSGQLKLRNKSIVDINNKTVPSNNPAPVVDDEPQ